MMTVTIDGTAGITTPALENDGVTTVAPGSASAPAITTDGDTNTGIYFPAADTIGFAEGGAQCGEFDSSANFKFNSGYGSVATAYGCRAWVNFNGTTNVGGFCTIRGSGNVTSVADNGTGDYTVNFTTAMPDANYSFVATSGSGGWVTRIASMAAGNCNIQTIVGNTTTVTDATFVQCSIFR
jgi:hypothetical protein